MPIYFTSEIGHTYSLEWHNAGLTSLLYNKWSQISYLIPTSPVAAAAVVHHFPMRRLLHLSCRLQRETEL